MPHSVRLPETDASFSCTSFTTGFSYIEPCPREHGKEFIMGLSHRLVSEHFSFFSPLATRNLLPPRVTAIAGAAEERRRGGSLVSGGGGSCHLVSSICALGPRPPPDLRSATAFPTAGHRLLQWLPQLEPSLTLEASPLPFRYLVQPRRLLLFCNN